MAVFSCRQRSRRPARRPRLLSVLTSTVAVLAACTAAPADQSADRSVLRTPEQRTTVLNAADNAELAAATSAELFENTPVVVLIEPGSQRSIEIAADFATRLGAPVLPVPDNSNGPVTAELARLAPQAVLAVGTDSGNRVETRVTTQRVITVPATRRAANGTLPDELPQVQPPEPPPVTTLVTDERVDSAAAATARATGSRTITVPNGDPRADSAAIEALHEQPPEAVLAIGTAFDSATRLRDRIAVANTGEQLPGGGQLVFPGRRLVCLYGHPGTPALGALGEQGITASIDRVKNLAGRYEDLSDVPVVGAFELIATVASDSAGADGDYSAEATVSELRPWVRRAQDAGLYVILDLQPGRADVLEQAKKYRELLQQPNVGLAIDPEWKLEPDQQPLQRIGSVDAATVNRVASWLAELTAEHDLPQKLLVLHQFSASMIEHEQRMETDYDQVSLLIHMDGQGSPELKNSSWRSVRNARPDPLPMGWKNFYDEDHPMLSPAQTMNHEPTPMMISYQ